MAHQAIQSLVRSQNIPEGKCFRTTLPDKELFRLTKEEWKCIKPTSSNPNKLGPRWTSILASYVNESNPYCAIKFKSLNGTK